MKYFAYGSNMLYEHLKKRVPSASVYGTVCLAGYKIAWHKVSIDGSGKCSIIRTTNLSDKVWGILYEIDSTAKTVLDKIEGLGNGYDEIIVQVKLKKEILEANTYIATNIDTKLKPYRWYRDIVIKGAIQNNLPKYYISMLKTTEYIFDSNVPSA